MADLFWWLLAVPAGLLPRRVWGRLDAWLPLARAASMSGLVTVIGGVALGTAGFFSFAAEQARANNEWMLGQLARSPSSADQAVAFLPFGMSILTPIVYLFFTPTGLCAIYLTTSGTLRAVSAWFDDPHGDYVVSGLHYLATTTVARVGAAAARRRREALEGPEVPDVLKPGRRFGISADHVVLASRRKDGWDAGATVVTSGDWYRLGAAFDVETPGGLRTAYPLTRLETVEVLRRTVVYELPGASATAVVKASPPGDGSAPG